MITLRHSAVIAGLLGLLPLSAQAGDAVLLENDASRCEIFRAISADVPGDCRVAAPEAMPGLGRARGIRIHSQEEPPAQTASGLPQVAAADPPSFSIAMRIQFLFDSAELTNDSKATLGQLAQVLQDNLMRDKRILLEGHADASGAEDYNLSLSERRANSVRDYLVTTYGVAPERLQAVGRGELDPYDPADPLASVNRRVEFTNLSDLAALQQ
ncbi:MAG: OmpA family protein [Alphaproteobacteria bacterium]